MLRWTAEVPPELLVSQIGRGWAVATTTLMHERRGADGIRTWGQVTDRKGRIAAMPYKDVARVRIGGTEEIPLIEDLIMAWPDLRFNVDLKDVPAIRPMMDVLRRTGAWDRVCVTSFSAGRLHAAGGLRDRQVCMGLSPAGVAATA